MRVLFAILVLALIALLWASISIAQHVRRQRRRRRRAGLEESALGTGMFGLTGLPRNLNEPDLNVMEVTPYEEAAIARTPSVPAPVEGEAPAREAFAAAESPRLEALQGVATEDEEIEELPPPVVFPEPAFEEQEFPQANYIAEWEEPEEHFEQPAFPQPRYEPPPPSVARVATPAPPPPIPDVVDEEFDDDDEDLEFEPLKAVTFNSHAADESVPAEGTEDAAVADAFAKERRGEDAAVDNSGATSGSDSSPRSEGGSAAPPAKPGWGVFRGFSRPSRVGQEQAAGRSMERKDWAYFNKDMGDLTDPYEAPRPSRIKDRPTR